MNNYLMHFNPNHDPKNGQFTSGGSTKLLLEHKKMMAVKNLSNELDNKWEYGVIYNGRRINTEEQAFDWENYRTIPLNILRQEKIGTCWDFVNYQHDVLNKKGIKNDSYLLMMDLRSNKDPDRIVTHTFTTLDIGGKKYWLESAMYPKRGLHKIDSYLDAVDAIRSHYTSKKCHCSIFKYNPDGMDKHLSGNEFINKAIDNNLIMDLYED